MRSGSIRSPGGKRKSLMLFCMFSIHAAGPFTVPANTSDMRSGSVQRRKECDSERTACAEAIEREEFSLCDVCLAFLLA